MRILGKAAEQAARTAALGDISNLLAGDPRAKPRPRQSDDLPE